MYSVYLGGTLDSEQILKALEGQGESYASVGRSLDPPVTRQTVRDVVVFGKSSTRVMEALAEAIGLDPAEVFPKKTHLFKKENTGKASHRSTVKANSSQTNNSGPEASGQSPSHPKAKTKAHSTPGRGRPSGKEMAA